MRHIFLFCCLTLSALCCQAQITAQKPAEEEPSAVNPKYLAGAVTDIDGHIGLRRAVALPAQADTAVLWQKLQVWMSRCMNDGRILNHIDIDAPDHVLRQSIVQRLTFSRTFLSLDQSDMSYLFSAQMKADSLVLTMTHITYKYRENDKDVRYTAEQQISDRVALNKKGNKLVWGYRKFRTHTIDLMDEFFESLRAALWLE